MTPAALLPTEPPLDPSGSEARRLLGRELLDPEYHDTDLLQRLLRWLDRLLSGGVEVASGSSPISTFVTIVVLLLLGLGLAWLLSRARRTARAADRDGGPVLVDRSLSAADLRAAAEQALAQGRAGDAVVEGFRALTTRQVERGRLDDRPGWTAREVAEALGAAHLDLQARVSAAARLFDAVLYGHHPASADQAREVLALDDELAGVKR